MPKPKRRPLLARGRLPAKYHEEPVTTSHLVARDTVGDRVFWTPDEAAVELGVPRSRVERWCRRYLNPGRKGARNGQALYRPADFLECLTAGSGGADKPVSGRASRLTL